VGAMTTGRAESMLGGRYRLGSWIAAGGMGEVWRAYDEVLGRLVAVKLLRSEYVSDPTFRDRFRTEARNTAALSHPGIVQVYDFGETTIVSGLSLRTLPYIAMELVPGEPLSAIIAREGAMEVERAASIVAQAAAALQAAHQSGVVHRDVKPANLLVTPTGTVKVTDFGIARAAHAVPLTSGDMVVGTMQYLAPEQTGSRSPATPLSDVYALGVVFYECLSGRHPFPADNPAAVALAHQHEQPASLPRHVPAAMGNLVLRMLAKDPAERPPSAAAVARQLTIRTDTASRESLPALTVSPASAPSYPAATDRLGVPSVKHDTAVLDPADAEPTVFHSPRQERHRFDSTRLAAVLLGSLVLAAVLVSLTLWLDPGTAQVPLLEGQHVEQAVTELEKQGFRAEITQQAHPTVPAGVVITQKPNPGTRHRIDRAVLLVVSSGQPYVTSPLPEDRAQDQNQPGPASQNQPSVDQQGHSGENGETNSG
jgi:serine/threonine protein kinase